MRFIAFFFSLYVSAQVSVGGNPAQVYNATGRVSPSGITAVASSGAGGDIVLGELLAFPGAFGAGATLQGGRGGTIYEVTNTNDSGVGSFRDAVEATGPRIALIKVTGRVDLSTGRMGSAEDLTIIGQTAPGDGITISEDSWGQNSSGVTDNIIIRHITWRHGRFVGAPPQDDVWVFRMDPTTPVGIYVDHCSMGWSWDEVLSQANSVAAAGSKVTIANNLFAEVVDGHNTAHVLGPNDSETQTKNGGDVTVARNLYVDISHRFPNWSSVSGLCDVYNQYISNPSDRLSRINGSTNFAWHHNYVNLGNHSYQTGNYNKFSYNSGTNEGDGTQIYTAFNYVEGIETTPDADDAELWEYFLTRAGKTAGDPVEAIFFTSSYASHGGQFIKPPGGILDAVNVWDAIKNTVGHTAGADANGAPLLVRDPQDEAFISDIENSTTNTNYRSYTAWSFPTLTSNALWPDADGDHIADDWEDAMGLNKNSALDATVKPDFFTIDGQQYDNRERTGGSYDSNGLYSGGTLTGSNLYEWREIYWSDLANDFGKLKAAQGAN